MNAIVFELVKVAELLETDTANSPLTRRDTIDIELRRPNLEDPTTGRHELYDNEQHNKSPAQSGAATLLPEVAVIAGDNAAHNTSPEATLAWHPTQLAGGLRVVLLQGETQF